MASEGVTRGACLCGTVRFEIAPPYCWFAYCHCSMCRKHHGALFSAGVGVEQSRFRWLAGTAAVRIYNASPAFERAFCVRCGAKTPAASHLPDVVLVPAGVLDADFAAKPRAHIFLGSRSPLAEPADPLRRFDAYPPGVGLPVLPAPEPESRAALSGRCLCGAVAYVLRAAPTRVVHCHCSLCRRSTGAPFATRSVVAAEDLVWTRGADLVAAYRMPPPRSYAAAFCLQCGSRLPAVLADEGLAIVPTGALDGLHAPLPGMHVHVASQAAWHAIGDDLPRFERIPPEE